ncbi:MAG: class I SAM-dependent methyltransferase [Patescibacteria group bacterium]|jgi:2-polyprenyl-3-methyl-5-hydroxy-6-metoxy-1,4-benzoquinol methylase
MSDYKKELYNNYVTTHTAHRKGAGSLVDFQNRIYPFNHEMGRFLPVNQTAKILDLGCGNGSIVWWLQQKGYTEASGIDISPEQIKIGEELGVKNIVCGDLFSFLEKNTAQFELIIARDVLEHFSKPDVVRILQYCQQALAVNGKLIVHVPNGESPFFGRVRYGDYTHELAFTRNTIMQIGQQYGFAQVDVYQIFSRGRGIQETMRQIMWWGVQKIYKLLLFTETGKVPYIVSQNLLAILYKNKPHG